MTDDAVLRASLSGREYVFDPSEDHLFMILEAVQDGSEEFVIVERMADGEVVEDRYAQSAWDPEAYGGFTVEYRDGSPDRHYSSIGHDLHSAHALLTAWSFSLPLPDAAWERLEFD